MATSSFSTGGGTGSNGLGTPTAGSYDANGNQISFGTGDPAAFSSQQAQLQNAYGWTPEQYASWASNPTNASQVVSNNNWAALQASQSPSQSVATKPATTTGSSGASTSGTGASSQFTVGGGGSSTGGTSTGSGSIIGSVTGGTSGTGTGTTGSTGATTGTTTNGATGISTPTSGAVTNWDVNPNQTVAGQISSLTDPNSPLIAQARAQALQSMNARGLTNSSLASTAADSAAYTAALPIAQQDASTNATAAQTNAGAANTLNVANLQAGTSAYTAQVQAQTQALNNQSAQQIAAANNQSQQLIAKMSNDTQIQVQKLQNEYSSLINSSSQASTSFNTAMQTIANINASTTMDANTKTQAIAQVYNNLQQQLQMQSSVSGLGVSTSLTSSLANSPGFDSTGKYVGFNADGTTKGSTTTTTTGASGTSGTSTVTAPNTQ